MSSKLRTLMVLFAAALVLLGCPAGGGGGDGNGGGGGGQGTNSVMIDNISDASGVAQITITEVSVRRSGTNDALENLIVEPIGPGEFDTFCCFSNGVYDVRVVAEGLEDVALNNTFEGPATHEFYAFLPNEGDLLIRARD